MSEGVIWGERDRSAVALSPQDIVAQSFSLAAASHQKGELEQAEQLYRAILSVQPTHADALHGLGVMAHQVGRSDIAGELIGLALAQRKEPAFYNNFGLVLLALDKPHEAMASIYKALELRAAYPEAYNALGNVQEKLGHHEQSIESYERALSFRPDYVDALANRGKALMEKRDYDAAKESCEKALDLDPNCAEVHNSLGNISRVKSAFDEAIASFDRALACRPAYAEAHNNRGVVFLMRAELDEAMKAFCCALAIKPDFASALASVGSTLFSQGKLDEAITFFHRAIETDPSCAVAYNNLGTTLMHLNMTDEAIATFEKAIALTAECDRVDAQYNLGTTLLQRNRLDQAIDVLDRALTVDATHAGARCNLGVAWQSKGEVDKAVAAYGQLMSVHPENAAAHSNKLMAMHYIESYGNDDVLEVARGFGRIFDRPDPRGLAGRDLAPERKLRVGYVSGDFNAHPVAFFFSRVLAAHDRRNFEVFCYSNWGAEDFMTAELRGHGDQWRLIAGMTDAEAAEAIRDDAIDILVDLAGHTNKTRVTMFGLRPAPVQVCWLGYFGTTGLPTMDYLILDPVSAPPGADRWYTESIVRLPYGRFCYSPPTIDWTANDPPCLSRGHVTFGCFNNVAKISPGAIRLWANVLKATPNSRLLLKWGSLTETSVQRRFLGAFAAAGIDEERIEFRGSSTYAKMLEEYNDIDIALDPFPFGGATTSCEALMMGVPVLTLPGDRLASRQTLGFLHFMGHADLAATSPEDYVARASSLAGDPLRLRELRHKLRPAMEAAPFCDGPKFAATLEAAYRQMWRRYGAGDKPEAFGIAP